MTIPGRKIIEWSPKGDYRVARMANTDLFRFQARTYFLSVPDDYDEAKVDALAVYVDRDIWVLPDSTDETHLRQVGISGSFYRIDDDATQLDW